LTEPLRKLFDLFAPKQPSEVNDATSCAPMTIDSTTDFVAATACSSPAPNRQGQFASQGDGRCHIVYNRNRQCSAFFWPDCAPMTRSGLRPDCDTTMKTRVPHIDRLSVGCHDRRAAGRRDEQPRSSFKQIAKKRSCISGTATGPEITTTRGFCLADAVGDRCYQIMSRQKAPGLLAGSPEFLEPWPSGFRSCPIMGQLVDNGSQIAVVFEQRLVGFALFPPQAEKHGKP